MLVSRIYKDIKQVNVKKQTTQFSKWDVKLNIALKKIKLQMAEKHL